jgi:hypothetical protein
MASDLKDLNREELAEALLTDDALLPQLVRQGSDLSGTRPFWRNKSSHLQAQARFLSPGMSPVFVTFSAVDMQWTYTDTSLALGIWLRQMIGVQNNPHIIAHFLLIRLTAFKKLVFRPFLCYVDQWIGLNGRAVVLAMSMESTGSRTLLPSKRKQSSPSLNSPSTGV